MCNNLNNEKKERIKIEDSKRKKRHDNLNNNEKEQLRKYDEKGKTLDERNSIFNNVQMCSMVDPSILTTPAFRFIEGVFKTAIQEGPTYICDICWKFKFRGNVIKLTNFNIRLTFIMNALLVNQIEYVKIVTKCRKIKCQCRHNYINLSFVLNSLSWIDFPQLS